MINKSQNNYLNRALFWAVFAMLFNLLIGSIAAYWGFKEKALTLLGFGLDNFAEFFSAIGLTHFLWRKKKSSLDSADRFEQLSLKITGFAFYILSAGLLIFGIWRISMESKPAISLHGIIISLVSIITVMIIIIRKKKLAIQLNSRALHYDAKCQKVCLLFSDILLADSIIYYFTGFIFVEYLGTAAILILSFKEGRKCLKRAKMPVCTSESYCEF